MRALLLLLAVLSGCADASAGGFPWTRRPSGGGGGGTPTVLQSNAGLVAASGAGNLHATLAFSSNVTAGSWLVAAANPFTVSETVTVSDTLGSTWTQRQIYQSGTYGYIQMWTAPANGAGADTVDIGVTTVFNNVNIYIAEVSNVSTYDTSSSGALSGGGYTSSIDWPSLTPSAAGIVLSAICSGGIDNEAVTLQAGWTKVAVPSHQARIMMWNNVSAGALTPHMDIASANYGGGASVALH